MGCNYDLDDAFAYVDGETAADGYQAHIDGCPVCRSLLEDVHAARSLWKQAAEVNLESVNWAQLDHAVRRRISEEQATQLPWMVAFGRGLMWAGAFAALVMVSYLGIRAMQSDSTSSMETIVVADRVRAIPLPAVQMGQLVTTEESGKAVTVAQAILEVAPHSIFRVAEASDITTTIDIVAGTVSFEVAPRQAGSTFKVRANNVIVTVVGTRFTVIREKDGSVAVFVEHGLVDVKRGLESASRLGAGDSIRMAPALARVEAEAQPPGDDSTDKPAAVVAQIEPVLDEPSPPNRKLRAAKKRTAARTKRQATARAPTKVEPVVAQIAPKIAVKTPVEEAIEAKEDAPLAKVETQETAPQGRVKVEGTKPSDPAVAELKSILKGISRANNSESILRLNGWLKRHPKHRKRVDARYAVGYCEFQRGNTAAANKIFADLPKNNRWIRKVGDYLNPPKPR